MTKKTTKNETEINIEIGELCEIHKTTREQLDSTYRHLLESRPKIPETFSQAYDYESDLLKTAQMKHKAVELFGSSLELKLLIEADIAYFTSQLKLHTATEFLKDSGFDKISESLRDSYVASNSKMHELAKIFAKVRALADTIDKICWAISADEKSLQIMLTEAKKLKGML